MKQSISGTLEGATLARAKARKAAPGEQGPDLRRPASVALTVLMPLTQKQGRRFVPRAPVRRPCYGQQPSAAPHHKDTRFGRFRLSRGGNSNEKPPPRQDGAVKRGP
jgi:hypothetical protein